MIPKIIHYVWLSGEPFPPLVQKCLKSWRQYMPEYKFVLWTTENFDINICEFTKQAYEKRKWAFVSDYIRLYALYNYGGWYLDSDVEVLKSFNDISDHNMVFGTDDGGYIEVVLGSEKGNKLWRDLLVLYDRQQFVLENGKLNMTVVNNNIERELKKYGYVQENKYQELDGDIVIFPDDYFQVRSLSSGKMHRTSHSHAIHWHSLAWVPLHTKIIKFLRMNILVPVIGVRNYSYIVGKIKKICNEK
ncbi:MAG: glycosyltransferase [Sodaliphilus pleomorphus]|jgi:mannosyltransferase OCH1-like enzyme|uniref:glycosyltransferase family 32 protein n=1 Tax=Sodaliphilus pleomorphus TaxID=2606626 RepID=UPI00240902FE|nr:glycosyltransferase [Sodaliphilus pleomorphus]MDD6474749.1 glycosyltransferase [Sodaliphilus pleomorphus]